MLARADVRAGSLVFAAVTLLGFDSGGYSQRSWRWVILAFTAVIALALLLRTDVVVGRWEWVALAGLAALTVWMFVSSTWGIRGTAGMREAERTLVYLSGLGAFLIVVEAEAIWGLLIGVLAGTVALASYGLGERALHGPAHDPFEGSLLTGPLGYANALGVLAAVGLVIALGVVMKERRRRVIGLAIGAAVVLAIALALTSSRGALLALFGGLLVLGVLYPMRLRRSPRVWLGVAVVAVAVAIFLAVAPSSGLGDRAPYWRAAIKDGLAHPLAGSGAGSFHEYWHAHGASDVSVQDAHSLYLESLAELGSLGLLLVFLVFVPPLAAGLVSRPEPAVAVAVAAYVVFLVHAGIDWDWEMPATTITGLACGAALLTAVRP